MIQALNISKRYDQQVLNEVSLDAPAGKTVALIGPSGCGKSTLMRIIMGLVKADSGEIQIQGEPLTDKNMLAMRRQMGYVIQSGGLFPHLSAKENLTLVTGHLGWPEDDQNRRIQELCELTNIPYSGLDRKPDAFSGGQAQRISLMRALMLDPEIVLLDEPLGSIDPLVRYELQRDLKSIFKSLDKTVLLITHDLGEAAYLGDTIALMKEGQIIQQGPVEQIVNHPADSFVEQFVNAQRSPLEDL